MAHADKNLIFNPEDHPSDTLKAFDEFKTLFEFRYDAEFPDPPKVSMDAAIERWKYAHTTPEVPNPKPTLEQYDAISSDWKQKDMVAKFIGLFSSQRLIEDWKAAEPDPNLRKGAVWKDFIEKLCTYYKPTDNPVLVNFQFRSLTQQNSESFHGFCNRVEKESKTCYFKCENTNCTADKIAVRDQVVIGTINSKIREEALLKSWNLNELRQEGMKIEAAMRGESELSANDHSSSVNKIGKYSYKSLKSNQQKNFQPSSEQKSTTPRNYQTNKLQPIEKKCYNCGNGFKGDPTIHLQKCPAKNITCTSCKRTGHFSKHCRSKNINQINEKEESLDSDNDDLCVVNLFKIESKHSTSLQPKVDSMNHDFKTEVVVNNILATVIPDTGAKVSVCGTKQAEKWNLLEKMLPSKTKLKPYNSEPIKVEGVVRCAVSFGKRTIPVLWHIVHGKCEPILSGNSAVQLGIIEFNHEPETLSPIHMISTNCNPKVKGNLQNLITHHHELFTEGIGTLKDYQVKFCEDPSVKPVITPPRPTMYHLEERVQQELQRMINNDIIEEHPRTEPAPWISAPVFAPKSNGAIRITMDSRNVNKAIRANNLPIPKQEDIKVKMSGCEVFTKLDLKDAFWQLVLAPESRHLTVFECNGKLYRYKRMTMGIKTAQGELNEAIRPILQNIPDAHHIHDDIIVASKNMDLHMNALNETMSALQSSGLKLNASKCEYAKDEIIFWGMVVSKDGVRPDPAKVEVLKHLDPPKNKEELRSFLCMMQSNAEFIPKFAKISAELRHLTKDKIHFKWEEKHQQAFEYLLKSFKNDVSLRYFDPTLPIYISTDAHVSGLAATLLQGKSRQTAKPVAFVSRRTTTAESRYPQIDLEAMGVDFGLRRFRNYILGAPQTVTISTDHKPLLAVFNGNRSGSIRTEKIKARNQDLNYKVDYIPGKTNETDYISRHAKPFKLLTTTEQKEADEINQHLFMIHTTPITDRIGLDKIAKETEEDPVLHDLKKIVESRKRWIPNNSSSDLKKFSSILDIITTTPSGILLKDERIILPTKLQMEAIQLAHQGSHVGQSGLQRRLRYHFFFHGMNEKVKSYVEHCFDCQLFTDKKTSEPLKHHTVPNKCWDTVAVDLFGPLPSKNHVVVVQDLASRYPEAKLVKSTKAESVIPVLQRTYAQLGNPNIQLSDNGPPFNSKAMQTFADQHSIVLKKTPPFHPSANPVETFMKPLGKTLKIAHKNKAKESQAIKELLDCYRDTPHPATGVPPNAMLFKNQPESSFPTKQLSDTDIEMARLRDKTLKEDRTCDINNRKYKQFTKIEEGDHVLLRNNKRTSKFQPYFGPDTYTVISSLYDGTSVKVQRDTDNKIFIRHLDDVKVIPESIANQKCPTTTTKETLLQKWKNAVMSGKNMNYDDNSVDLELQPITQDHIVEHPANELPAVGRGRGRPRGPVLPPILQLPDAPMEHPENAMPELVPAVRKSERIKNKTQTT